MPNAEYVIMSDSCSDIPVALEKELDLLIVPLSFTIGVKSITIFLPNAKFRFRHFMIYFEGKGKARLRQSTRQLSSHIWNRFSLREKT